MPTLIRSKVKDGLDPSIELALPERSMRTNHTHETLHK